MTANPPRVAMLLAAGLGTRMRPLTDHTPKPLLQVGNSKLIDLALGHAVKAGVERAVVNLHYLGDQIRSHLAARRDIEILYSEESPEILETGGGIKHALPLLGNDPFFVLNTDAVWAPDNPLESLLEIWEPEQIDAALLMVPRAQAVNYTRAGDFFLQTGSLAPTRRGQAAEAPFVFSGAQIIKPQAFADAPQGAFSLNVIWDALIQQQRLGATSYKGKWVDVGTPAGLEAAARLLNDPTSGPT